MSTPKRRRRKRLLIILSRNNDDAGVRNLSEVYPVYDLSDIGTEGTTEEQDVATAIDNYYLAYDPNDDENFNAYEAAEPSYQTLETVKGDLETALTAWRS